MKYGKPTTLACIVLAIPYIVIWLLQRLAVITSISETWRILISLDVISFVVLSGCVLALAIASESHRLVPETRDKEGNPSATLAQDGRSTKRRPQNLLPSMLFYSTVAFVISVSILLYGFLLSTTWQNAIRPMVHYLGAGIFKVSDLNTESFLGIIQGITMLFVTAILPLVIYLETSMAVRKFRK